MDQNVVSRYLQGSAWPGGGSPPPTPWPGDSAAPAFWPGTMFSPPQGQWPNASGMSKDQMARLGALVGGYDYQPPGTKFDDSRTAQDALRSSMAGQTTKQNLEGLAQKMEQGGLLNAPVTDQHIIEILRSKQNLSI